MFRSIGPVAVLALLACAAFSAPRSSSPQPNPQPTEVKIISVPTAQPTEVKIISTPPATPVEVKIVSAPQDESAPAMVRVTWGLLIANVVLCGVTVCGSLKQGRDLRRRDRAAMEREINRAAQRNMTTATRLDQMAQEVPAQVQRIHQLAGKAEVPDWIKADIEQKLQIRRKRFGEITDRSVEIVSSDLLNLKAKSDNEVTRLLWTVDSHEVQLQVMREAVTADLALYEREISVLLQRLTAMQAAAHNAKPHAAGLA